MHPPRVLVVDDEKHVRGFLREVFSLWGCEVDAAADGREGLRLLVEHRYDLVVTDLHMPGVNGLELIQTIRREGSPVPVVMLTAATEEATSHSARLDFALVPKPVQLPGLQTVVQQALGDRPVVPGPVVS